MSHPPGGPQTALRVLRKRQDLRRAAHQAGLACGALKPDAKASEWVFADKTGARIGSIKTSFYAAAAEAGLPDISPHTLRHTFAAWLVQAGVPLRTVCELCRHKDIRTTMRYAHLAPENSREAIKVLDTKWAKSPGVRSIGHA